jgi:histidyl-tRNA synthetase
MNVATKNVLVAPISGFPDYLPEYQAVFDGVVSVIKKHYDRAGAMPIDTPLVERKDVLTAKGGGAINKEIYGLTRLSSSEDGSASDLGIRFDLTVPLARYVSQHQNDLVFPFRRQHIARVYRGERAGSGRFREFYQADIDVIGRGGLSVTTDAEPPAIINDIFTELCIGPFVIRINNRKILAGYFESLGFDSKKQKQALAVVDKADNGKTDATQKLCETVGCSSKVAEGIWNFIHLSIDIEDPSVALMEYRLNAQIEEGIDELCNVLKTALAFGVPKENLKADLSVARGLDYYTGTVYETILLDHPSLGSICSGGRYDDLTSHFTDNLFPGVGISIGVSRLVSRLVEANVLTTKNAFKSHVLITQQEPRMMLTYVEIAKNLRRSGVPTEIFFEEKGLGHQLKYATRKGFRFAVILGTDEAENNVVQVKDLDQGTQVEVETIDLVGFFSGP